MAWAKENTYGKLLDNVHRSQCPRSAPLSKIGDKQFARLLWGHPPRDKPISRNKFDFFRGQNLSGVVEWSKKVGEKFEKKSKTTTFYHWNVQQ